MTSVDVSEKAGTREWVGLAVLVLTAMLISFDFFVLLLALPQLSADLGADGVQQLWIMDIYGFFVGGLLITMGGLGDRIGRRKLLLIGGTGFALASVLTAYSTSPEMLIAARALLGIFGATLVPSTLSLLSHMFKDPKERGLAIGIWAGAFTVGAILGPITGGILLEYFWWGSVFLIGVPILALLLILGPSMLPEFRNPDAGRLDLVSVFQSLAAILPFIYGVKETAKYGLQPLPVLALLLGIVFGVLFVRRQNRLTHPLLDLRLFSISNVRVGLLGLFGYSLLTGAVLLLMSQWLQSVAGLSAFEAGLALVPGMITSTLASMAAPILARRFRPAYLIGIGLLITVVGLVVITQASSSAPLVIGAFAVWTIGGAPVEALGIGLILGATPPEKAGSASALPQVFNEMGSALGFALLGTVATVIYRVKLTGAVPAEVPPAAVAAAQESVAGAKAAAQTLPEQLGEALLGPARLAYNSGMHVVALIAAVLLAAVAVLIMVKLRHEPPLGAAEGEGAATEAA
ncbi:MFS transporter [Streptosporangium sp. NBC_01639]|uniref:MFS transporter n=1 Tax=Streptosporangium sp. NBC_01639 TaxID=2975948 RepID=UPI0038672C3E|nr:MFS transporter [Streptosporangium sp. NBC_01639]